MRNKLKNILLILVIVLCVGYYNPFVARADSVTDNALNFLKLKQDLTGRVTTGFSAPSQWSAIAFAINGIDIAKINNTGKSLKEFLLTDVPSDQSSATDWENRILAIVAIGEDPSNFGGINYVQKLETFYKNNQIGDTCSLNDDVFGLLSLIVSGDTATPQIKQGTLNFLIQKQDPQDGGFGFSAPECAWYSTSADMTGAAIQALQAAKENKITTDGLDDAITKAKNYLLTNQNSDGGFGYFGSSDPDTTGWVLMAFNVLGLKDSNEALTARTWLLSQQSVQDGGFQAYDWGSGSLVSNATTTAQSLIALSGKGWVSRIFIAGRVAPTASPSSISIATPSSTGMPTSTPTVSNNKQASIVSPTPLYAVTPTPSSRFESESNLVTSNQISSPSPEVLGESTTNNKPQSDHYTKLTNDNKKLLVNGIKSSTLLIIAIIGLFIVFKFIEGRRSKK